jgi:hypothetical protein
MLNHENESYRYEHVRGWEYFHTRYGNFEFFFNFYPFLRNKENRMVCEIRNTMFPQFLKGSDDCVWHWEPVVFRTLSIVRIKYKNIKSRRFGSWFFFRLRVKGGETPTQMGPLDRANLNHCTSWFYIFIFYPDDDKVQKTIGSHYVPSFARIASSRKNDLNSASLKTGSQQLRILTEFSVFSSLLLTLSLRVDFGT